jgi:SWI/SNF-related matrix-associated actin-dependent regulator 1 of chromatin subfamily A
MTIAKLFLNDDHLILDFPYNAEQVAELKRIDGAKWDKLAKVWRVPMTSTNEARDYASKHGFDIDPEVLLFDLPKQDNQVFGIRKEDDWIYLSFHYDPVKVKAVKTIPSITWHAKTKAWRAPIASIHEVIDWATKFREVLPEDLAQLSQDLRNKHLSSVDKSRATEGSIDVAGLPLLPYQRAGVEYAAAAKRCFIADDMGLGKTLQAIATLESTLTYPAVIMCPPNLVLNWEKEYHKWLPARKVATVTNRKEFPDTDYEVLVIGYSNIGHWEKQLLNHNGYVLDESHYIKSATAQRTKSAIKITKSAPQDGVVLCLTGTPITNRPAEYGPQLDALGKLNDFGGLWGFYRRYCGAFRDRFGQWNISGNSHMDELNEKLRGNCYIRRTKDQVLLDLPPVRHNPIYVSGTDAAMREYKKAEADIVEYLVEQARRIAEEIGKSPKSAEVLARIKAEYNQALVEMSVLRRLAAKAKMPAAIEIIEQHIESGHKVVIAAHHRDIVDELAGKYGNLKIQGGMDVADVEACKSRFQDEPVGTAPVMVLSIQAAKTGHTLTASQDVIFMELPWTPSDLDQTYSRCHRLGQKGSVTVTYLLCEGTIDEHMFALIEKKRSVVDAATEGGVVVGESLGSALVGLFTQRGLE